MLERTLNKEQEGMFVATIVFRWAALFHILLLLFSKSSTIVPLELSYVLLGAASIYSALLSIFREQIAARSRLKFGLLFFDIVFSFAVMTIGGGWRSVWYLYTFSTVLMAAVFYKVFGALAAALVLCAAYTASLMLNGMTMEDIMVPDMREQVISNFAGYILAGCFVGYPAKLIQRLHEAKLELEAKNRKLEEADKIMVELKTNTEELKDAMAHLLEPKAILKLLVARQFESSAVTSQGVDKLINDFKLTKRELEFLKLLAQGKTNIDIAAIMQISKRTVETHRKNVFQKLGANSAASALLTAIQKNIIDHGQLAEADQVGSN